MKPHVAKELLFSYFAGQATPFQKQLIDEWTKQPDNREQFFAWLEDYESVKPQYLADVSAAIERHRCRLEQPDYYNATASRSLRPLPTKRTWLAWLVAASISLFAGFCWLFQDSLRTQSYTTAYGQTRTIVLSDGSHVTLNANSTLRVSRFNWGSQTRDVLLTGEAVFSVKHTPDNKPFVVKTNHLFEVVVLGTEFIVYNRHRDGRVILNRGKVQLRYQEGSATHQFIMKPGDQVTMKSDNQLHLRRLSKPENMLAWRDNRYVFDETPFSDIVQLFQDNYGLTIHFTNTAIAKWTVSGSFTARNADELLETLTQASGLGYSKEKSHVFIMNAPN